MDVNCQLKELQVKVDELMEVVFEISDRLSKLESVKEQKCKPRKLTLEQVKEILSSVNSKSVSELSRTYKVSRTYIYNLINGKRGVPRSKPNS